MTFVQLQDSLQHNSSPSCYSHELAERETRTASPRAAAKQLARPTATAAIKPVLQGLSPPTKGGVPVVVGGADALLELAQAAGQVARAGQVDHEVAARLARGPSRVVVLRICTLHLQAASSQGQAGGERGSSIADVENRVGGAGNRSDRMVKQPVARCGHAKP